jgi:hypothetical protein
MGQGAQVVTLERNWPALARTSRSSRAVSPEPSSQYAADETRALCYRDFLHVRSRGRRREDQKQMVSRAAIRPKSKARWTALDRIH